MASPKKIKAKRLLIADDTEFYRLMLKNLLEKAGYLVDCASTVKETLEKAGAQAGTIDLIILDFLLEKKSGPSFLRQLAETRANRASQAGHAIPVLVMGRQYQEGFDIDKMEPFGVRGYFDKSHPMEELLFCVNQILFPEAKNLRKSPRAQVSIPVYCRIGDETLSSHTFNLSRDGMFIITTASPPPQPNTKIGLRFWLPPSESVIECEAIVIWCNNVGPSMNELYPPGMGVMFLRLSPAQNECINGYVREKLSNILRW